jgi:hypothetical protein
LANAPIKDTVCSATIRSFQPAGAFHHLARDAAGGADNQAIHIFNQTSDRLHGRFGTKNDFGAAL